MGNGNIVKMLYDVQGLYLHNMWIRYLQSINIEMRRSISKILLIISYIIFSIEYKLFTFAETVNVISNDINILRGKGKSYLLAKNFRKASQYYSAILQIIEKDKHNTISDSLRRRCALTLAECEIQTGNWAKRLWTW